jgi:hypothetical protein
MPWDALSLALGASFASGLNLYATCATLGLLQRFGVVQLPTGLEVLAHPVVLGLAIILYLVEFFADKIPYVDSLWDAVHTFIRPAAAALLAFSAMGDVPETWRWGAGLLAGGIALTSHGTKATTRAAANTTPEPVSNWLLSLAEDGLAIFLAWMAATYPYITLVIVLVLLVLCVLVLITLYRFFRFAFNKIFRRGAQPTPPAPA